MTDAFCALDPEWRFVYVNRRCGEVMGKPADELLGRGLFDAFPEIEGTDFHLHLERALRARQPVRFESTIPPNPGVWIDTHAWPASVGLAVYLHDVTERKRAEEALRRAEEALRRTHRRRDKFLATLAHELRNPLAPIRNAIEILRRLESAPAPAREACAVIDRQLTQLTRLVDDLLDVSRITHGRIALRKQRVEASAIIERAIETNSPAIQAAGHYLVVRIPLESPWVTADPMRAAQVVSNLIDNAARYTPEGGRIEVVLEKRDGQAAIIVRDNGIGIDSDVLPRVFDLFVQADEAVEQSHGGLGVGLSIALRLAEMHGGTVLAASRGPGSGSEFTFLLPLEPAETPGSVAPPPDVSDSEPPGQLRVLVVDDNEDAASTLVELVRLMGDEAHAAYSGPQALERVKELSPDLVLLDIGMPGMSGYEVARQLLSQTEAPPPRLVAMTGWGQPADQERSRRAGFHDHVVKPVSAMTLEGLLRATAPVYRKR